MSDCEKNITRISNFTFLFGVEVQLLLINPMLGTPDDAAARMKMVNVIPKKWHGGNFIRCHLKSGFNPQAIRHSLVVFIFCFFLCC